MTETGETREGHCPMTEREILQIFELSGRGMTWDEMGRAMHRDPRDLISFLTVAIPNLAATISARSIARR